MVNMIRIYSENGLGLISAGEVMLGAVAIGIAFGLAGRAYDSQNRI